MFTRGDNFQAFDGLPIIVDIIATEEEKQEISKAIFVINKGDIQKTFENPVFPLEVEIDENDSKKLKDTNIGELVVFDRENRPLTCNGRLTFTTKEGALK